MQFVIVLTIICLATVLISLGKRAKIAYSIRQIASEFSEYQNAHFDWNVYLAFLRTNFNDEVTRKLFMDAKCYTWFSQTYAVGLEGWDDRSTKRFIEQTFLCR